MSNVFRTKRNRAGIHGDLVANVIRTQPAMGTQFNEAFPTLEFSDDANFNNLVTPSGGTVTIQQSENGSIWAPITDGTGIIVSAPYVRPSAKGNIMFMRATPTTIVGALYWRMLVTRIK